MWSIFSPNYVEKDGYSFFGKSRVSKSIPSKYIKFFRVKSGELKFGFSEKATKFDKNLCRTFDKSVVFCARNSILVKKSTKIFQNICGQVVLYKL